MMVRVPLERIRDNPFQTRMEYGDVGEIVASLLKLREARPETSGLIQVPPGRVVLDNEVLGIRVLDIGEYGGVLACLGNEPEAWVELAAGHRRFRAFQRLHNGGGEKFGTFPVEVQVLDDQVMADIAWEENAKRKDLSAVEEAQALRRAMERFGWTQTEVGGRWGLSQSAVANKLRLLQLPEEAQAAIQAGQLSERHGRALLKAMGKSQRIYARVAEEVIPVAVEADVAAKARALVSQRHYIPMSSFDEAIWCEVCAKPADDSASETVYVSRDTEDGTRRFLCLACYRAATDWVPPSVAETEAEVERSINRESRHLRRADWPLGVEVGGGDPLVHQAKCEGCGYRDDEVCLDKICFQAKMEHWYGLLVLKFKAECRRKWPDDSLPPVIRNYEGHDLSGYSETDKDMIRDGWCSPECDHLRFRYSPREQIRPFEEYPFIWNCDNTNRCNACRRRYLRSQETDEEQAAAKEAKRQAEARRGEARGFLRRAELSVARALQAGHEGAWRELAGLVGERTKAGQSAEESALMVAKTVLRGKDQMGWIAWELETAVGAFEVAIKNRLKDLGVGMMPGVEDLVRKLERIQGFLLGEDGLPRAGLTDEQVRGNLDNLSRLAVEVADGVSDVQERERLLGWVRGVRELFPGGGY